jgi:tetratricopeptide (TPR) repeat protein
MRRDRELDLLKYWRTLHPRYCAAETYTRALSRYEATKPSQDRLKLRMRKVSDFIARCGYVREATAILQKIRQLDDETFKVDYLGELQESRIDNLFALARNLVETGKFEQAETVLRQAQEISDKLPAQNGTTRARFLNSLAYLQKNMQKLEEAERNYRAAIALAPLPAYTNNLATLLKELGQTDEAERLYRSILEGLPENDNLRAVALANLGDILLEKGRKGEAETCYRNAVEIDRAQLGPTHFQLAVHLCRYADALTWIMKPVEAEKAVAEAVSILEATLGPDNQRTKDACEQRNQIALVRGIHEHMLKRNASHEEDSQ